MKTGLDQIAKLKGQHVFQNTFRLEKVAKFRNKKTEQPSLEKILKLKGQRMFSKLLLTGDERRAQGPTVYRRAMTSDRAGVHTRKNRPDTREDLARAQEHLPASSASVRI